MTSPLDLITNTKRIQKLEELLAEAYAKMCEEIDMEVHGVMPVRAYMIAKYCAAAIRARSA